MEIHEGKSTDQLAASVIDEFKKIYPNCGSGNDMVRIRAEKEAAKAADAVTAQNAQASVRKKWREMRGKL